MLAASARSRLLDGILLACALGCPAFLQAAGLTISPVVIEIDSPRKAIAVTVTNNGDHAVTFQTDTMIWKQVNGVDQYEPTSELLIAPPIVRVRPNASQTFRVTLRVPTSSPVERSYRVILEDISDELSSSGTASVAFKFTHNLPVMLAPTDKVFNAIRWKPCASEPAKPAAAEVCVHINNAGNRRVKVQNLTLAGNGWQHSVPFKEGINVSSGAEREWRIPLQAGQTGALQSVQIFTARGETIDAQAGGF